ncbi:MAG: hypothetical protein NT165_03335 [Candidatus Falkowbacteria bacterium]|nr:hypothetical protein [Candidatus Falkowbacteria bacterium]
MDENFQRIIRLIKKTGDKMVFFDSLQPENSFVVLPLEVYERELGVKELKSEISVAPLGLTEDGIADKINRDLLEWKNQENSQYLAEETAIGSQYFTQGPPKSSEKPKNWQIPGSAKQAAEEIIE